MKSALLCEGLQQWLLFKTFLLSRKFCTNFFIHFIRNSLCLGKRDDFSKGKTIRQENTDPLSRLWSVCWLLDHIWVYERQHRKKLEGLCGYSQAGPLRCCQVASNYKWVFKCNVIKSKDRVSNMIESEWSISHLNSFTIKVTMNRPDLEK